MLHHYATKHITHANIQVIFMNNAKVFHVTLSPIFFLLVAGPINHIVHKPISLNKANSMLETKGDHKSKEQYSHFLTSHYSLLCLTLITYIFQEHWLEWDKECTMQANYTSWYPDPRPVQPSIIFNIKIPLFYSKTKKIYTMLTSTLL